MKNYDDIYYGASDLATATVHSDNSIFAELGFGSNGLGRKGPQKVGETAERMGIDGSELRHEPGHDPRRYRPRRHAARDGLRLQHDRPRRHARRWRARLQRRPQQLARGPVPDRDHRDRRCPTARCSTAARTTSRRRCARSPRASPAASSSILRSNVVGGTGELAQTGSDDAWGKTGTTDNNGDAWFCGGTEHFTACVWVGHAQTNTPMETEYAGGPVDGGTFPAIIWSQVMQAVEAIYERARGRARSDERRRRRLGRQQHATRRSEPWRPAAVRRHDSAAAAAAAAGQRGSRARSRSGGAGTLGRRRHRRHRPLASARLQAASQGRDAKRLPAAQ